VIDRNDELLAQRTAKVDELRAAGIDPYPPRAERTHTAAEAVAALEAAEASDGSAAEVSVAGRVTSVRTMGKAAFLDLRDASGRIQIYIKRDVVGADAWARLKAVDLGDFLGVRGKPFRTRTGEPSVEAAEYTFLAKSLQAPPEKWHGLQDVETRYRRRYLDLISNEETRVAFRRRSEIMSAIRRFMDGRGFIEVETPVLQASAGGAAARPFSTHFNDLDEDRFLRIALELHLKRLIVGGYEKVYEIGRLFRNEGTSFKHSPEFTMMESYEAYADYNDVADMLEQMVATVATEVLGNTKTEFRGKVIDFAPPWRRITLRDALIEYGGLDIEEFSTAETLRAELERRGLRVAPALGFGKLVDEAMSHYVEPKLIQPTFLLDYPVDLSPLAKKKPDDPRYVERWEPFAAGMEFGNAYTELNDPIDQRERLMEQVRLREAGDVETESLDEDFLFALEHGMPPTGGLGVGIDRLVMILTGQPSIRDVILFPQLRTID
jgi:lysyl-tRNA synthetase class 2